MKIPGLRPSKKLWILPDGTIITDEQFSALIDAFIESPESGMRANCKRIPK